MAQQFEICDRTNAHGIRFIGVRKVGGSMTRWSYAAHYGEDMGRLIAEMKTDWVEERAVAPAQIEGRFQPPEFHENKS